MAFNVRPLGLPTREPVTIAELKAHLNIDPTFTADDLSIADMIAGARQQAEDILAKTLVPRRWLFVRDEFPAFRYADSAPARIGYDALGNYTHGGVRWNDSQTIVLPQPPLISVEAVRYLDPENTLRLLDAAQYQVDNISQPGRILPAPDGYWPATRASANAVQIEFTAGYAQTVTGESLIVPTTAPYARAVAFAGAFEQLLSAFDAGNGNPVPLNQVMAGVDGTLTFASAWAGKPLALTYRVLDIPASVKMAIKIRAASFYENREEFTPGATASVVPSWFESMLEQGVGRSSLFGYTGRP